MGGMSFPYKINSISEYVEAFMKGDGTPVYKLDPASGKNPFIDVEKSKSLTEISKNPELPVIWH